MASLPHPRTRAPRLPALLLGLLLAAGNAAPARADELDALSALLARGSTQEAATRLDAFLARQPKDARARFLRARILVEQRREAEAIGVYRALTEDFPELPEPYNNLAVLEAARGRFDEARRLLEMATRAHPGYSTAWENLGDLLARLAWESYGQALQAGGPVSSSLKERRERLRAVYTETGATLPPLAPSPALRSPAKGEPRSRQP
jgi:colicin import membrane protein